MKSLSLTRLVAASLAFAPLAVTAQSHPERVEAPKISVGDRWTFEYVDKWTNKPGNVTTQEVVELSSEGVLVDAKRANDGRLVSRLRFTAELNPLDRGNMHFSPAYPRYAFPLEVGKTWEQDVTGDNPTQGKSWRYKVKGRVAGWEKVAVKAGRFDALKVEVEAYYQGRDTWAAGGGRSTETVWFAPAVNSFVKLDYQDTDWNGKIFNRSYWELTAFEVKQPSNVKASD